MELSGESRTISQPSRNALIYGNYSGSCEYRIQESEFRMKETV